MWVKIYAIFMTILAISGICYKIYEILPMGKETYNIVVDVTEKENEGFYQKIAIGVSAINATVIEQIEDGLYKLTFFKKDDYVKARNILRREKCIYASAMGVRKQIRRK